MAGTGTGGTGVSGEHQEISPRSGVAFTLNKGDRLTVIDPRGEQVADLVAFNRHDLDEVISNGRTLDYASKIYLTTGDPLYSNRSNVLLRIVEDTVGRHDFLLTPCSADTFRIIYGDTNPHRGCFGNLAAALDPYGIAPDRIPVAFNCFMNVPVDGTTGALTVEPPLSKAGDHIVFVAEADLIVGLTACSALQSNNGSFKPIHYRIDPAG
ncbi:urea carboxylase-associated family protein [Methylobacterium sp. SD21]|uniref:urea carboxylase-associated family protein n=1 Tax=Methylobacterium litchii TaxID=3138810 RepID=UPI00313BFE36